MLYITQLIFVKEGKEETFLEFERFALPHLQKLGGKLLYRFRPNEKSIMHSDGDPPYEIHIITFNSKEELQNYLENDERKKYLHLKEDSVSTILSIKEVI